MGELGDDRVTSRENTGLYWKQRREQSTRQRITSIRSVCIKRVTVPNFRSTKHHQPQPLGIPPLPSLPPSQSLIDNHYDQSVSQCIWWNRSIQSLARPVLIRKLNIQSNLRQKERRMARSSWRVGAAGAGLVQRLPLQLQKSSWLQ